MVDIENLKPEIIDRLKPLKPDKIILFGSYAYGNPTVDSDIDFFLLKDNLRIEDYFYRVAILRNGRILYEHDFG